jgi:hypothetical protein
MSLKKQIAAFITTFAAMLAGVAFAAWTATGTGNGYAKATTGQNLTFNDLTATVTATLYPGATSVNYQYSIHNPNPYQVTVNSVTSNNAVTVVAPGTGTCTTTGVSYTAPGTLGTPITIAGGGNSAQTFAGASMDNTSDTGCQGATFGLALTATGASS